MFACVSCVCVRPPFDFYTTGFYIGSYLWELFYRL